MKLAVFLSPNSKTGTSTVGNYVATSLAKKTQSLTLYIEFSKITGRSLFFHGKPAETRRSISEVVYDPRTLQKQIIKSKYTEFLHFICMNIYEDFLHMTTYVPSVMANIVTEASRFYEYIIIDLPANFEEPMVGTVLSRNFEHRIDNFICVLDEDVLTAKLLYDLEALLKMGKESKPKELTYVVNKTTEHYIDYLERSLDIGLVVPVNLINLPYILEIKDCTNRADVYKIGTGPAPKKFYSGIDTIRDILITNKRGIGLDRATMAQVRKVMEGMGGSADTIAENKLEKAPFSLFGGKKKSKVPKGGTEYVNETDMFMIETDMPEEDSLLNNVEQNTENGRTTIDRSDREHPNKQDGEARPPVTDFSLEDFGSNEFALNLRKESVDIQNKEQPAQSVQRNDTPNIMDFSVGFEEEAAQVSSQSTDDEDPFSDSMLGKGRGL